MEESPHGDHQTSATPPKALSQPFRDFQGNFKASSNMQNAYGLQGKGAKPKPEDPEL